MDPFTLPLAFGCMLTFAQIDRGLTESEGQAPDGVVYRMLTVTDASGNQRRLHTDAAGEAFSPGTYFRAGRSPDGQFASYLVFSHGATRDLQEVRFVSARTCAPVKFIRARDGGSIDAGSYQGWAKDAPHTVRILERARRYEPGLPADEARASNPSIKD